MTNTTSDQPINTDFGVLIAISGVFVMLINIFFFTMGLVVLQKRALNMLIISLCGSDFLYGLSLFILAVSNLNQADGDSANRLWLSQIILFFVSMSMDLTIALLICVERFTTLQRHNYGMLAQSENSKKKMFAILLTLTMLYVVICIVSVPRKQKASRFHVFYMVIFYDTYHYQVVMSLLSALFVSLCMAIIFLYMAIICMMFRFMKQLTRILPTAPDISLDTVFKSERHSATDRHDISGRGTLNNEDILAIEDNGNRDIVKLDNDFVENLQQTTTSYQDLQCISSGISANVASKQCFGNNKKAVSKEPRKKWELSAISISAYIIGSTMLFDGPLIVCLVLNAEGITVFRSVENISAVLVALLTALNPFIYTYCLTDLRTAMKKILRCQKVIKSNTETTNAHADPTKNATIHIEH